ncbi:porin family protein [bacterium SGD-2]|nr:porin family protein [bacterium SGD-2]
MRAILSISILSLISAPSFAADIIFDPDPVPPIVSLPEGPFTWSGRYVGVDLGFGRGKVKESFVTENIPESIFNIRQTEGAFGGNEWVGERGDTGYTLGGGFDYAINRNTIAKLEYQYLDFGNRSFSDETDYARVRVKGHTLRAGVAYKF